MTGVGDADRPGQHQQAPQADCVHGAAQAALAEWISRSSEGIGLLDQDLRFVYVNPAGCTILGQPLEQLIGQASFVVAPPDGPEAVRDAAGDVPGLSATRGSSVVAGPDGREREIEYVVTSLEVEGRRFVGCSFRDATEDRRAERWARAFARITSGMAATGGPATILDELSRGVVDATGMVGCAAILFDPGTTRFRVVGAHGLPDDYGRRFEVALAQGLDLPAVRAFESGTTVVVRSSDDAVLSSERGPEHGVPWQTIVSVPMVVGGRITGVLKGFLQASLLPAPDLVAFLDAIGDQAAVAVENSRLFAEARESSRRQEALVQAGLTLASEFSLPTVLNKIVELACDVADATYGALGVLGPDGALEDFIVHGVTDEQRSAIGHQPEGRRGLLGALINDARPVRLRRLQDDPRSVGFPPNHPPMTSFLGVPVSVGPTIYGNLYVAEKRGAPDFTEGDERAVVTLAAQAGVTIENARLFSEARDRLALEERARLARELHDSVSQALFAMTLETGAASLALEKAGTDPAGVSGRLARLRELTDGALAEMRALILELRPDAIREEGLVAAIRKMAEGIAAREDVKVSVNAPDARLTLPPEVEEQLYRLTQEALSNVTRHARAGWVDIRVSQAESRGVVLEIEDDGVGFDPVRARPGHLGLRSMSQRAEALGGSLKVSSSPGKGTCVRAVIPPARREA